MAESVRGVLLLKLGLRRQSFLKMKWLILLIMLILVSIFVGRPAAQNGGKPNPFNFRIIKVFPNPNNVLEDGWVHKADITIEFTTQKDGTVQYAWCSKAGGKALSDTCRVPYEQSYDGFSMLSGFGAVSAEGRDFVFWDRKFCPADASDHNGIPNSHRCVVWAFHATAKVTLR